MMLYSGTFYALLMPILFLAHISLSYAFNISDYVNPGYWNPPSLFNLNQVTHGIGIEDILFMFLVGSIASVLYETIFRLKAAKSGAKATRIPIVVLIVTFVIVLFFRINPIYSLIIPALLGGLAMVAVRKELIKNAVWSSILLTGLYITGFMFFNLLFPYFLETYYNLQALSGILVLGVPVEEYFYASTFGFLWGPLYKCLKGLKS